MSKVTGAEEDLLESVGEVETASGWGEKCPACSRPHVFTYRDGTKLCDKCDELVARGSALTEQAVEAYAQSMRSVLAGMEWVNNAYEAGAVSQAADTKALASFLAVFHVEPAKLNWSKS